MVKNYFGITDVGRMRDNNEDAFIAEKVLADRYLLACVIDGVGGYAGGEVAAAIARQSILDYFSIPSGDMITMMKEALVAANEKIGEEKQRKEEYDSMACVVTLALVDLENNQFYYAHVGDTRLYLLRDNSLVKVTKDHSFVGFLEDSGRLSEEAAMNHPKRNEINRALGFDERIGIHDDYIETGTSPFLPGDMLLLCSDGLSDLVNSNTIISILTGEAKLEEKGKALVDAANERGGKDNITVVLVQNTAKRIKQKAVKPAVPVKKNESQISKQQEPAPAPVPQVIEVVKEGKSNKGLIVILSLLCIVFLAGFLWLFFTKEPTQQTSQVVPSSPKVPENPLGDSLARINLKTVVLSDSLYPQPIILSDTLLLQKDSLHIKGFGKVVLTSDSLFTGPAIVLSPTNRYVLLENLTFQNFDVGIITNSKALHLKNVRFVNCRVPVQYQFSFPDSFYVNGAIKGSTFFKSDSLPK